MATSKIYSEMVSHVSPSSWNGSNLGDNSRTLVLVGSYISLPEESQEMWRIPTYNRLNKKYVKLPDKVAEEKLWNKLCVDLIDPYKTFQIWKEPIILKAVTIIDPVTGWFEITQYIDKKWMTITNLVEATGIVMHPWRVYIDYNQGGEFLGQGFKISMIK